MTNDINEKKSGDVSKPVDLKAKLARTGSRPGVYLMKNRRGRILYVGKAQNLKKRLASYFKAPVQTHPKIEALVQQIADFDTIITRTEKEALILESNLIKRHRPKYNVELKDDKRYPSLRLDVNHPYPNLGIVRKIKKDGALYFGPFSSAKAVRQSLRIIHRTFKLRKCHTRSFKSRTRACLNYQLDLCHGPCCLDVDRRQYGRIVREVILFLKGRTPELIQNIKKEMQAAATAQGFEKAAVLRDRMFALKATLEKQVAVTTDFKDRDVIALDRDGADTVVMVFFIRGGFLLGTRHFEFETPLATDAEISGSFIRQYYDQNRFVPGQLLLAVMPDDADLLAEWLHERRGTRVHLLQPQRGEKRRLVHMTLENAQNQMKELLAARAAEADLLARLKRRLRLAQTPRRIECFDNSNISGTHPVASMVVFKDGLALKLAYRHFRIRDVRQHDDYAYMMESLGRRFKDGGSSEPLPDLLMVDGGKGQLNIALAVVRAQKLEGLFDVIGIAKKDRAKNESEDKIFKPGRVNPINFGRDQDLLLFLQRIRDEAHRFAIGHHRKRRAKSALVSELDKIPGVGPKRRQALLKHFKSIDRIRTAPEKEIAAVDGVNAKVAQAIKTALSQKQG